MDFLCRDVDETKSWMNEKDTALLSDDYGRDLASVQALQRKHEGLERDLAALEDKVTGDVATGVTNDSVVVFYISLAGPNIAPRRLSVGGHAASNFQGCTGERERGCGRLDQPESKGKYCIVCCI